MKGLALVSLLLASVWAYCAGGERNTALNIVQKIAPAQSYFVSTNYNNNNAMETNNASENDVNNHSEDRDQNKAATNKSDSGHGKWIGPAATLTEEVEVWRLPTNSRSSMLRRLENSSYLKRFMETYRRRKLRPPVQSSINLDGPRTFQQDEMDEQNGANRKFPVKPKTEDDLFSENDTDEDNVQDEEKHWPMHEPSSGKTLSHLSSKDYEIALWFGFSLGALFILIVGGSIALVRKIVPGRFKSAFQRFPYGRVNDLSFPPDTEYSNLWSPLKMSEPGVYVTTQDGSTYYGDGKLPNGP